MAKEKKYIIEYLGKTYKTDIHADLTDEQYEEIVRDYYTKPDFSLVEKQLKKLNNGGVMMNHVTNYYFKDLMAKVKMYYNNWSLEEVLQYKPLVEWYIGKTLDNDKVYPKDKSLCYNFETATRLCSFRVGGKVSQFPKKAADSILEAYNVNGVYYDYSCGWGTRMISSLSHNVKYLGTDPNNELIDSLHQLNDDLARVTGNETESDIRCQGSEHFIQEWEGKVGLAFSSPPYFCLEDYKIGDQSYKPSITTYESWKEDYLELTIKNIYRYLVDDGYFVINLNNFRTYYDADLVQDAYDIAVKNGFYLENIVKLTNNTRVSGHIMNDDDKRTYMLKHDNDESMYVFKKQADNA